MAHKSHKIALRVNPKQTEWFHSQCGYVRFACNNALADFKAGLASGKCYSGIDLNNHCEFCYTSIDRDQNAAIHLKNLTVGNHTES